MKIEVIECGSLEELLGKVCGDVFCEMHNECSEEKCNKCTGEEPPVNVSFFIERIAEKKGWKPERVAKWLNGIQELYPVTAFNIVLKEIAIWLDKKYEGSITKVKDFYVVSTFNGKINHIKNDNNIKNFRNFAAFRTLEDAKFACKILKEPLKLLFKCHAKD